MTEHFRTHASWVREKTKLQLWALFPRIYAANVPWSQMLPSAPYTCNSLKIHLCLSEHLQIYVWTSNGQPIEYIYKAFQNVPIDILKDHYLNRFPYQWRSQNAEKVTHVKGGLLDQAMSVFNCVPFKMGTSLKRKNLLPERANYFLYEQFFIVWKITFITLSDLPWLLLFYNARA